GPARVPRGGVPTVRRPAGRPDARGAGATLVHAGSEGPTHRRTEIRCVERSRPSRRWVRACGEGEQGCSLPRSTPIYALFRRPEWLSPVTAPPCRGVQG